MTTLLSSLVGRFSAHPEVVATTALGEILRAAPDARASLLGLVHHLGGRVPGDCFVENERAGAGGERPDLALRDDTGREAVLVEAKFWAGLTDNQPVTYLERLPPGGTLLVLAPRLRLESLWPELVGRVQDLEPALLPTVPGVPERRLRLSGERLLALVSWQEVLQEILAGLDRAGRAADAENVRQLLSLCDAQDRDAFLPLQAPELGPELARRVVQYTALVDDVVERVVARGWGNTDGLRRSGDGATYGRYMLLNGHGAALRLDFARWARLRETPIWLALYGTGWQRYPTGVPEALREWQVGAEPRLLVDEIPVLPLALPLGVGRARVVDRLAEQVGEVAERLRGAA